ncbi:MAG TPA: tetratricopeptide repeat protein [Candidatus Acidoferrum sp.]|nr:tetratricopeptide repeat protein [Candidatus Acidoferrum sp.]
MSKRRCILAELAFTVGLLAPLASAQKPPAPPSPPPIRPAASAPSTAQPAQPEMDSVKFLMGRVATSDGTPVPHDVLVERICNERVRQQVYVSPNGDFSMEMGSKTDSFVDATAEVPSQGRVNNKTMVGGLPLRELEKCELQASAAGLRSTRIRLFDLSSSSGSVDVGAIVVERTAKTKGAMLSARPYMAPPNARKAYERGLDAENKGKLDEAGKYFEQAVKLYPKYASAWLQLGTVRARENQKDSAREAYIQAATIDTRFLPPFLSLASMAFEARDWSSVLQFTRHVMDLDPLTYANVSGYVVDLDEWNSAQAYFYNAVANYQLKKFEDAEKSALKAEHADLLTRFPQVHILLAEIFARKKDYAVGISEVQAYLELVPHARDADFAREQLARWKKLSSSTPAAEKPVQN